MPPTAHSAGISNRMLGSVLLVAGIHLLCCGWTCASLNSSDTLQLELKSETKCPALVIQSRIIDCTLNEQIVDCGKPMTPGTKAVLKCKAFYYFYEEYSDYETTCMSNGRWSRPIVPCNPECGDLNPITRIPGYHYWWYLTDKNDNMDIPWHAGIYEERDGKLEQICGGTIISDKVIMTAAHCFWDSISGFNKPLYNGTFRVAVGKIYRDWYKNEENIQSPEIQDVTIHKWFKGKMYNWANDLASVSLKDAIEFTKTIRPICVDFTSQYEEEFIPGKVGIIAGWGGNANELRSDKLRKVSLPYVDLEECKKELPESFIPLLAEDKFCAGFRNGTSVCPGDGGGGLAIRYNDGKWYFMGVVSVFIPSSSGEFCNTLQFNLFTNVLPHIHER